MRAGLHRINTKQSIVLGIMVLAMLMVWPICLVRRELDTRSGDEGYAYTGEINDDGILTQSFTAAESYLKSVDFAVAFDVKAPRSGKVYFELLNAKGRILKTAEIPYEEMNHQTYYSVPIKRWVLKNAVYTYKIKTTDMVDNLPKAVYTTLDTMHAENNTEMWYGESKVEGQSLTRYVWKIPLNYRNILCIWGFIGMVGFVLFEFAKKEDNT